MLIRLARRFADHDRALGIGQAAKHLQQPAVLKGTDRAFSVDQVQPGHLADDPRICLGGIVKSSLYQEDDLIRVHELQAVPAAAHLVAPHRREGKERLCRVDLSFLRHGLQNEGRRDPPPPGDINYTAHNRRARGPPAIPRGRGYGPRSASCRGRSYRPA